MANSFQTKALRYVNDRCLAAMRVIIKQSFYHDSNSAPMATDLRTGAIVVAMAKLLLLETLIWVHDWLRRVNDARGIHFICIDPL
jgi:hypothetical protein